MKVTLIGTLPPIKALSPYCYHLAVALSKKVDLDFINFKSILPELWYVGGSREKKSYSFDKFSSVDLLSWYNPFSLIKAGLSAKGQIVHFQHWQLYASMMYCFILPILKIRGKKIIVTVHNITPHTLDYPSRLLDKILNSIIFPFADHIIIHNKRNKKKLQNLYKVEDENISILPHGSIMPYQKIKNIDKKNARNHLKIPMDKKIILFFGYMWTYKGLDVLLKALSIIKEEKNDIALLIAGQPRADWQKFEKIIRKNSLENFVIKHLKFIDDSETEHYFSASDLVVLPYYENPFDTHGGVGALAISFKKPLVVTDVGGLPEYVKDERVISQPNNPENLAKKIIFVLNDEKLMDKLSKDSEVLSKELNWDDIAENTVEIYNRLLK